ncbi:MAG: hypothetical protein GVY11_01915 [Gammaproteobacteria bacterium]|nr:hypothetical protein [Gammaproteobacteria bacterium]
MSDHKQTDRDPDGESGTTQPGDGDGGTSGAAHAPEQGVPDGVGDDAVVRRGANAPAWMALLLSLAVAALVGWQWWSSTRDDEPDRALTRIDANSDAIDRQSREIEALGDRVDSVDRRLDDFEQQLSSLEFDPAELRGEVRSQADSTAELGDRVSDLSQRLDQLDSSLESQLSQAGTAGSEELQQTLAEARFRLAVTEVAGLLRLGQSQAELAGDTAAAVAAYRRAGSRLEAIGDGRLERLRQLVARELEALRSVETTDWAGLSGRLSALESESAQWPLAAAADDAEVDERSAAADADGAAEDDGWWSSLRRSVGGLVRVTPRESAPLTPAAAESVRERVRLHLAAAQAAAARRNLDELAVRLESVAELMRARFDTSAEAVKRALGTLEEAAAVESASLPELGDALAEAERRLGAS